MGEERRDKRFLCVKCRKDYVMKETQTAQKRDKDYGFLREEYRKVYGKCTSRGCPFGHI